MTSLPRRTATRTAKLATLPLGYAGRKVVGVGKRLGGASAEAVGAAVSDATAAQLFAVLGELKGGAMKVGQALSVLEAGVPEEVARPYRAALTKLQEAAPPLPPEAVHTQLAAQWGPRWRAKFASFDDVPAAAASIGQVHKAVWKDGRTVAVKIQYPGAGDALISDLGQLSRVARLSGGLAPGIELQPVIDRLLQSVTAELDYDAEARHQAAFGEGYLDSPNFLVPAVVYRRGDVLVSEWIDGTPLADIIDAGTQEQRNRAGNLLVEFLFGSPARTGLLHADPHPGNYRLMPDGRLGVLDFGAVEALPDGLPPAMGRLVRAALEGEKRVLFDGLVDEGFLRPDTAATPEEVHAFLEPYIAFLDQPTVTFTRPWLRDLVARFSSPRSEAWRTAAHFNLPPQYVLIERVWLSGVGVLCQLGAKIEARRLVEQEVPGFART